MQLRRSPWVIYSSENAFSLSLVRHNRVTPDVLWELKAQTLKKSGLMTLHRGGETFSDLGGLEALKGFCTRALRPGRRSDVRARGVLLLGPQGSGKSACAKALEARYAGLWRSYVFAPNPTPALAEAARELVGFPTESRPAANQRE